ncbi:hypothetical protein [Trichocoleus desertorum]|uniref:hypothetical protein n=1 Tax=Trichocoleus desertorum TaxID=1481672 RepID=UPI0032983C3A
MRSPIGEKLEGRSLKPWILRNFRILNNLSKAGAIALPSLCPLSHAIALLARCPHILLKALLLWV